MSLNAIDATLHPFDGRQNLGAQESAAELCAGRNQSLRQTKKLKQTA